MTIDPTKIRPGDKVTVEGVVLKPLDDEDEFYVRLGDVESAYIPASAITSHTPAPREFKVGDRVGDRDGGLGEIIAIHSGRAWIAYDSIDFVFPLSDLTHIEGEPG